MAKNADKSPPNVTCERQEVGEVNSCSPNDIGNLILMQYQTFILYAYPWCRSFEIYIFNLNKNQNSNSCLKKLHCYIILIKHHKWDCNENTLNSSYADYFSHKEKLNQSKQVSKQESSSHKASINWSKANKPL